MSGLDPMALPRMVSLGPITVSEAVVTTWAVMVVLTILAWMIGRRAPGSLECLVETLWEQIEGAVQVQPRPFLPLLGTLFLFILTANLTALVPGAHAPTARLETTAALAAVVFLSVHVFGIRQNGLRRHLSRYLKPTPLLLPLNLLAEVTRTLSLMIRLFGNIMSHELILAVVVMLAGLLVPVPLMLLGVLIGAIQAYIFTMLAAVFIGAAVTAQNGH